MRRREFVALAGSIFVAWPKAVSAQSEKVRKIGILMGQSPTDKESQRLVASYLSELKSHGWENGRNLKVSVEWGGEGDPDHERDLANRLISEAPDLLLGSGIGAAVSLKRGTTSVPIIFVLVSDPIGVGLVSNFARPGANITGFSNFELSIAGKWLELLKQMAPAIKQVEVLGNPATSAIEGYARTFEKIGEPLGVRITKASVRDQQEITQYISSIAQSSENGLVVLPDAFTIRNREQIISLAAQHNVPAVYPFRFFAESGGLMSYGPDRVEQFRQAGLYADRILRGEQPQDLPVQQPTKFELVINLKTAKTLGLTVPVTLQASANDMIE